MQMIKKGQMKCSEKFPLSAAQKFYLVISQVILDISIFLASLV